MTDMFDIITFPNEPLNIMKQRSNAGLIITSGTSIPNGFITPEQEYFSKPR
jgi:hypothetical protein